MTQQQQEQQEQQEESRILGVGYTVKKRDAYALACRSPKTKRFPEADLNLRKNGHFSMIIFGTPCVRHVG